MSNPNLDSGSSLLALSCPLPLSHSEVVLLGHGSGGRLTAELIEQVFLKAFNNETLARQEDQATLPFGQSQLAFTTDSFVVRPLFFPGGDIGQLAVYGTINDLAVGGADPLYISAAFIIEEGMLISDLKRIALSMRKACDEAGVTLVTGDTKVVDRGKGDQLFITTSGIGRVTGPALSIHSAQPGDHILLSGPIGDHGMAILSVREGIEFETELKSDCAPLNSLTKLMLQVCPTLRCMRDPTRGGIAGVLNELASASQVGVKIDEAAIPIRPEVRGACEILGLDPYYVANEGKLIAVVPPDSSTTLLKAMRTHPLARDACLIGQVIAERPGMVTSRSTMGGERIVTLLSGEQLPRIC